MDGYYYSVPHALIKKQLDMRITPHTIECFYRSNWVASHRRSRQKGRQETGPATEKLILTVLSARKHPQQAHRSCLGILRLGKAYYGDAYLKAACRRQALTLE